MSIVVVGSMAFDSIETPFGRVAKVIGGSANHFALSAGLFTPVQCVSVVGEDFPTEHLELLRGKKIDTAGIRVEKGLTFHWSGKYGYDLNNAQTLKTDLNVFEHFEPNLPENYRKSDFVFLGNIVPALQLKVLAQIEKPKFVAIDTMNFWIESAKPTLIEAISKCHCLIINEAEIRQLTETHNIVQAAQIVRGWGPQITVVKQGEYGAMLFDHGDIFRLPALPLSEVKDPTGAGDTFAGGFMGFLASQSPFSLSRYTLRKAVVYGNVMASFTVQDYGTQNLVQLSREKVDERFSRFLDLTSFHQG